MRRLLVLAVLAVACGDDGPVVPPLVPDDQLPPAWQDGLAPGVNLGLAAAYPGDVGIAADPDVFAAEGFESGAVEIPTEDDVYASNVVVVSSEHYTGSYAGEHSWPEGLNGPTSRYLLGPEDAGGEERPAYFIRMYIKYDASFHPGDLTRGVGVKGFGVYAETDDADNIYTPCDGINWYDAAVQFVGWGPSVKEEANDGYLWVGHLYSYNPWPTYALPAVGTVEVSDPAAGSRPYRFSSYAEPFTYIKYGEWHSYEVGLYLNTPGVLDGEARFWIDGVLQSRVVRMGYRQIAELLPTSMQLNLHRTTEDFPQTMVRWVDNIVLARRYIGPVVP